VQPNGTASLKAVQEVVAHAEELGKGHSIEESHLYWYHVVEWGKRRLCVVQWGGVGCELLIDWPAVSRRVVC
jgi:hypothetical protein